MKTKFLSFLLILLTTAAIAQVETQPLYRYKSDASNWIFTTSPRLPPGVSGRWTREAVVAHVPKVESADTRPIYSLVKADTLGVRYAYTRSANESAAGWQRQEAVAFYVLNKQLPGTEALYRLYAPLRTLGDPDGFSAPAPGSDTHYYTADDAERKQALAAGWVSQGVLGYVWLSAQTLPDLSIQKADATTDSSVTAVIRNGGTRNVSGSDYTAVLTLFDATGAVKGRHTQPGRGLSPNQAAPVVFETGDLVGMSYRVAVDEPNGVTESNEDNNVTPLMDGPRRRIRIGADIKPAALKPAIRVSEAKLQKDGRTRYTIQVLNAEKFAEEWFVSAGPALPPNPCGDGRMLAIVHVIRSGERIKAGCESLNTRNALQSLTLLRNIPLEDDDRVQLSVYDRLLDETFTSDPFSAGWTGVGTLLNSAGCKHFLGQASSFLCADAKGFAACESLRKNGKPISCRQQGVKH